MAKPLAYPEHDGRSWRCDGCDSNGRACGPDGHRRAAETIAVHIDECTPGPGHTEVLSMAVPAPARPFLIRLTDGRTWGAVEFPNGFVCVHHPDEINVCTIAVSLDGLLADRPAGHPLHGAKAEDYG